MTLFPGSPLDKTKLRSLLAHLAQPQAGELSLSGAELRKTREWAIAANLLNERGLTVEGNLVAQKDPYLETTVTDWLLHFHLSSRQQTLWNYVVYEFLPEHATFTQDELLSCCTEVFPLEHQDTLNKSLRFILRAYTEDSSISKNKFLRQQKKQFLIVKPDLSNPYTTGYFLAKTWERDFKARESILVTELINTEMGLRSTLGVSQELLLQQLDLLAKYGIIEQRSAKPHLAGTKTRIKDASEFPYQVHRCWHSAMELLEQAYERDASTPNRPLVQSLESILGDDDNLPDFSQFLEWASRLTGLDGGSNTIAKLVS